MARRRRRGGLGGAAELATVLGGGGGNAFSELSNALTTVPRVLEEERKVEEDRQLARSLDTAQLERTLQETEQAGKVFERGEAEADFSRRAEEFAAPKLADAQRKMDEAARLQGVTDEASVDSREHDQAVELAELRERGANNRAALAGDRQSINPRRADPIVDAFGNLLGYVDKNKIVSGDPNPLRTPDGNWVPIPEGARRSAAPVSAIKEIEKIDPAVLGVDQIDQALRQFEPFLGNIAGQGMKFLPGTDAYVARQQYMETVEGFLSNVARLSDVGALAEGDVDRARSIIQPQGMLIQELTPHELRVRLENLKEYLNNLRIEKMADFQSRFFADAAGPNRAAVGGVDPVAQVLDPQGRNQTVLAGGGNAGAPTRESVLQRIRQNSGSK